MTWEPDGQTEPAKGRYRAAVGEADPELDQRLSDELDQVNAAATTGIAPARELTVRILDDDRRAGSGHERLDVGSRRRHRPDLGARGRRAATGSALGCSRSSRPRRGPAGARHVFVTSFTFQAPGFYERHGYREIFRWQGVPTEDAADVHFRKDL